MLTSGPRIVTIPAEVGGEVQGGSSYSPHAGENFHPQLATLNVAAEPGHHPGAQQSMLLGAPPGGYAPAQQGGYEPPHVSPGRDPAVRDSGWRMDQRARAQQHFQQKQQAAELLAQIEEKKASKEAAARELKEREAREDAANAAYNPWGRGGGGAPLRDAAGQLQTDLRHVAHADGGVEQTRQAERAREMELQRQQRGQGSQHFATGQLAGHLPSPGSPPPPPPPPPPLQSLQPLGPPPELAPPPQSFPRSRPPAAGPAEDYPLLNGSDVPDLTAGLNIHLDTPTEGGDESIMGLLAKHHPNAGAVSAMRSSVRGGGGGGGGGMGSTARPPWEATSDLPPTIPIPVSRPDMLSGMGRGNGRRPPQPPATGGAGGAGSPKGGQPPISFVKLAARGARRGPAIPKEKRGTEPTPPSGPWAKSAVKHTARSTSAPQGPIPDRRAGRRAEAGMPPRVGTGGSARPPPSTAGSAYSGVSGGGRRGGRAHMQSEIDYRDQEIRTLRAQLEQERALVAQRTQQLLEPHGATRPPEALSQLVGNVFPANTHTGSHGALGGGGGGGAAEFDEFGAPTYISSSPTAVLAQPAQAGGDIGGVGGARGFGAFADPYLAASKACVRADGTRCSRLEAGKMLSLCARYRLRVPADMAEAARRKGLCSYTIFIDRLRELNVGTFEGASPP